MFNMSKTKLLILSLMVIKPICSTNDYTKLIKVGDTVETYVKRMKNRDLPNLGESYEEFTKNCKNSDFTLDEYEKLMDSFPIIYELLDSFARRKQGSITYEDENLNYLIEYYPEVYESYSEYIKRIENKEDSRKSKSVRKSSNSSENSAKTEFILTHDMFRNLKRIFPNIGESYENYILRIKQYGIKGLSLDYFSSFITLIPKRHESLTSYLSRFKVGHAFIIMNNWKIPRKVDTYIGLKRLIPRLGESYLEYEKRMTEIDLSSMQLDIFNTFQKLYPQLNEEFRQYSFRNNSFDYSKIIYLDELQQVEFTLLKRRLPILFENFDAYKSRIMEYDNDNDSTIVYEEFYNARRMYPKLSESYNEYSKRLSDLSLEIWSENFFLEFKMNYPQIDYSYEDLHKNTNAPMLGLTYAEYGNHVQLDRNKFEILKTSKSSVLC
uniref:Uncharacterized protein n=1 Tax=Sipha flava TaxID=143950 RepID=A0A2S2QP93_9HEMI